MKEYLKFAGVLLFAFVLPLPLPHKYASYAFILMLCNLLVLGYKKCNLNDLRSFFRSRFFLVSAGISLLELIRSCLTLEFNQGIFNEVKIPLLVLPFFIYITRPYFNQYKDKILQFFALGVVAHIIIAWTYIAYYYNVKFPLYKFSFTDHFVKHIFLKEFPGGIHHTYMGMYMYLASLYVFVQTFVKRKIKYIIGVLISFFIIINMMYLASKSTIALLLITKLLIFVYLVKNKLKIKFLKLYIITFVSAIIGGVFVIRDWLSISIETSFSLRYDLYERIIGQMGDYFVFGIGLNQYIDIWCKEKGLITHNMFLNELVINGVLGIFLLFYFFYVVIIKAIRCKNKLLISLLTMSLIVGLIEDIFYRQRGIMFLMFFITVFYYEKKKEQLG